MCSSALVPVRFALVISLFALSSPIVVASDKNLRTFETCWRLVRDRFYDSNLHGVDWQRARLDFRDRAAAAPSRQELSAVLNEMLATLKASHTAILEPDAYRHMNAELNNERLLTVGLELEEGDPGRYFARALYEGGPAEVAGIRYGDRIVLVNGDSPDRSDRCIDAGFDPGLPGPQRLAIRVPNNDPIRLWVQPLANPESRREVVLEPRTMNAVDACRNSVRTFEHSGLKLGTIHIWYCSDGVAHVLRAALRGPLRDCDALVIDLRGRGGKVSVLHSILAAFGARTRLSRPQPNPLWTGPLVFLTDERTRSAKEVIAFVVREDELGKLVGEKTEGAVLGAGFFELPNGTHLELATINVSVRGVQLEGRGVAPHYQVSNHLPFAGGRDKIFEEGCRVAVQTAKRRSW